MIYLSAQPDHVYFIWQLQLQLFNFSKLGIPAGDIHVLIGYHPERGLSPECTTFINTSHNATFFTYPDNRKRRNYESSIRPHLIKQHLRTLPHLNNIPLFYHDADIIFHHLPDFSKLVSGPDWYISETLSFSGDKLISYVGVDYIRQAGDGLLERMCHVVGIPPETVISHDAQCGGAQYLLKGTDEFFWDKVEQDSEDLYDLLQEYYDNKYYQSYHDHLHNGGERPRRTQDGWFADMWSLLWNAWLAGTQTRVHASLAFCTPSTDISCWGERAILHYCGTSGRPGRTYFNKNHFREYPPFFEDFRHIATDSCSYPLVALIDEYRKSLFREDLRDVTFLIPVRIDSEDRKQNLLTVVKWLYKYFDTHLIILEADGRSQLEDVHWPEGCTCIFVEDDDPVFRRTHYNNRMAGMANTPLIVLYDTDVICPPVQIMGAVNSIRNGQAACALPFNGTYYGVDMLFKRMFGKLLDVALFQQNMDKMILAGRRTCGGAVFFDREVFMSTGMENEHIESWGPEDMERLKRVSILGYTIKRINGALFHLYHPRYENSGYQDSDTRIRFAEEFLRICHMTPDALQHYISTWPWVRSAVLQPVNE